MKVNDIFNLEKYSEAISFVDESNGLQIVEIEPRNEKVKKTRLISKVDENGNNYYEKEIYEEIELVRYFQIVEIAKKTLEELKEAKREEINQAREEARKTEGAEYDGDIFDIDEVSQSNILAQIKVADIIGDPKATYNYRSKTNTDHLLTLAQLQELGLAIAVKVNAIYVKSWDLKAQVDKATTAEEVEDIKWTSA